MLQAGKTNADNILYDKRRPGGSLKIIKINLTVRRIKCNILRFKNIANIIYYIALYSFVITVLLWLQLEINSARAETFISQKKS